MSSPPRHLTALDLDRLDIGVTEAHERERIEAHVEQCQACAARRSERAELGARFRDEVFARTAPALGGRPPPQSRRWLLVLAAPALAATVLVVFWLVTRSRGVAPEPTIALKGDALLHVYARRSRPAPEPGAQIVKLADGARLAPGDALRFVLDPAGLPCVMIASVDGGGGINIYFPFHGEASASVDRRAAVSVPGSIVLDEAPGPERLFVIYSEAPLDARAVRRALAPLAAGGAPAIRAARRVALPGGAVQATLLFEKDRAR